MEAVATAKTELSRAKDRMLTLLAETPDDRLRWKPSSTSRSILEVVAHTAHAIDNIREQMAGTPFPIPTSNEAGVEFLKHDAQFETREQVIDYLESACDAYYAYVDALTEADLAREALMPFGLGPAPLTVWLPAPYMHTYGHCAQIEYIQTIYGDNDTHFGF